MNRFTTDVRGGLHAANLNIISQDFSPVAQAMKQGNWAWLEEQLLISSTQLQSMGSQGILLANNTLHQLVPAIEESLSIPFLHIVDALGDHLKSAGITKVGILGTSSTMTSSFYSERLMKRFQIESLIPSSDSCQWLDRLIFNELCHGEFREEAKQNVLRLIDKLVNDGAGAIALACTELPLLLSQEHINGIPLINTSRMHCEYAVNWSLNKQ